ncbi:hypothetical protein GF386_00400, partial [Candidatus Pacearchaeota archaeon]|nr:hypothetical protein [Candidatus Pacearchaeota archaeon]
MYKKFLLVCLVIACFVLIPGILAAEPLGANYTEIKTETSPDRNPEDHDAYAGNVTELEVTGYTTTQSWQGYFGNVSGTIELSDASSNVLYNWSQAAAEGEIYAINDSASITWSSIRCYN